MLILVSIMSKDLLRKNFSQKMYKTFKDFGQWHQKDNWIETVRSLLGMTLAQLGKKLGVTPVAVRQVSEKEKYGEVTLKKMQEYARALECEFVYALVPKKDFDDIIAEKAQRLAEYVLKEASLHMEIEDQEVNPEMKKQQIKQLTEQFKKSKKIWD